MLLRSAITSLLLVVGVLVPTTSTHAASFAVHPIKIELSAKQRSSLLAVRNASAEKLRFQISVHEWTQSTKGEIELKPTKDIVFYPRMLTLQGKEERNVRVGLARTFVPKTRNVNTEKTYRIVVKELPNPNAELKGAQIRVITHMSVPIFISPKKTTVNPGVGNPSVGKGKFSFEVSNKGNSHTVVRDLKLKGVSKTRQALFTKDLQGWYVLAGGVREYSIDLPKGTCGQVKSLTVEGRAGDEELSLKYPISPGACKTR